MANETSLKQVELFSELSARELQAVQKLMTRVEMPKGRDLMKEGTPGREFVVIVSGDATVRRGGRVLARVTDGDFLGELAVIAGVPRTATVTADSDMTILVLNRREFSSLLDAQPKLARKVLVGAVKRLHDLDPSIVK